MTTSFSRRVVQTCTPSGSPSEIEFAQAYRKKVAIPSAPGWPFSATETSASGVSTPNAWSNEDFTSRPKPPAPLRVDPTPSRIGRWKNSRVPRSCSNARTGPPPPRHNGPVRGLKTTPNRELTSRSKRITSFDDSPGCIAPCNTTRNSQAVVPPRVAAPQTVPNRVLKNRFTQQQRPMSARNWSNKPSNSKFTFEMGKDMQKTSNWSSLLSDQSKGINAAAAATPTSRKMLQAMPASWKSAMPRNPTTTPRNAFSPRSNQRNWAEMNWDPVTVSPAGSLVNSPSHRTPKGNAALAAACFSPLGKNTPRSRFNNLSALDTSPKNPDAVVMNTPTGKFVRAGNGKWVPLEKKPREFKFKVPKTKNESPKKIKEDRFGSWCKNRQNAKANAVRNEFAAAVLAANNSSTPPAQCRE